MMRDCCSAILMTAALLAVGSSRTSAQSPTTGDVVVRVDDTSGSHCIDATTERVTVFVRRVFVEKKKNIFTEDGRAGVLVRSTVSGAKNSGTGDSTDTAVKVPAVDMVSIKDDLKGRVSLALEYPIASGLVLKQGDVTTKSLDLYMELAKTKGKTTFGTVLDVAGQALNQLPIPPNPYTQGASKFLKFTNDAIDASIKGDNNEQIAHIALQFNEGKQDDLAACKSQGNQSTGAVAVLRSTGIGPDLIPVTNTEAQYCFRYSSNSTFELLAAKRLPDGGCPPPNAFSGVNNDYVMLLISAQTAPSHSRAVGTSSSLKLRTESITRCQKFRLPALACGN